MFEISKSSHERIAMLKVNGYCNQEAGDELLKIVRHEFETGSFADLIIDFAQCSGVNSPGVARVLEAAEIVTEDFGGSVVMSGLDKIKRSFFQMVGILELAAAAPDETAAIKLLS